MYCVKLYDQINMHFFMQPEEVPMENLSLYARGQQRGYPPNHLVSRPSET